MALSKIAREAAKKAAKKARALQRQAEKPPRSTAKNSTPQEVEGARKNPDTQGSDRVARDVEAGKAGEVTFGKAIGFLQAERTPSSRAIAQVKADLQKIFQQGSTATAAEKKEARRLYKQLTDKDSRDTQSAKAKGADTAKATKRKPKPARTDYVTQDGEIIGNPTDQQIRAASRNLEARGMTGRSREILAKLEKPDTKLVGPRQSGSKITGEDIVTPQARRVIREQEEKVTKQIKGNFNRGGSITKKKMGAIDYRKGGMVYSTAMKKRGK